MPTYTKGGNYNALNHKTKVNQICIKDKYNIMQELGHARKNEIKLKITQANQIKTVIEA